MSDLFKSKKTTTTNETSSGTSNTDLSKTTTPIVPNWVLDPYQTQVSGLGDLAKLDPSALAPGPTDLQTQAATGAAGLTGSPWNFDGAADLTRGVAAAAAPHTSGVQAKGYIDDYMNPYLDSVVNSSLADFDFDAGKTRAQDDLNLAGSGAFGGSGAALTKSMTADSLARARASLDSGLRSSGFTEALGAAQSDATRAQNAKDLNAQLYSQQMDRALASARQLGDLSTAFDANQRANAGTQASVGEALRQILQEQGQAPYTQADTIASILSKFGLDKFIGEDSKGTTNTTTSGTSSGTTKQASDPSTMDKIGTAAQIAAMFFSDIRLKKNIVRLGALADGLGVYAFDYIWGGPRQIGVMAQEAQKLRPDVVAVHPSGFLMVDYGRL